MTFGRWQSRAMVWGVLTSTFFVANCGGAFATPLHNGLISYWRLNEGTGTVANDTAPAGNVVDNGTLRNAPTWISGKFNSGLQFDGVSKQDVLIPASSDMDINTNAVTLSAWVKLDQLPSETAGFSGIYDSTPDNYAFYLDKANNELRFKATAANGVSTLNTQHPGVRASLLNTTDWIHVMGVYDGDAHRSKLYFNGQLIDVSSHTGTASLLEGPVRTGQIAGIGGQPAITDPFTASNLFKGSITDVAVWNRALGLGEAQYLYNGGVGNAVGAANPNINPILTSAVKPTAQPVVYYKFDGSTANSGTGGSSLDAVVHGPHAAAFTGTNFGSGLDLTANPVNGTNGVAGSVGTGTYLSVDYKLADSGTIAGRFAVAELFNYGALWSNSGNGNDWEAWYYLDGRVAARADRLTQIVAHNVFNLDDPGASTHYAFTWSRTGNDVLVKLFVNGEFVDERLGVWRDPGATVFLGGDTINQYGKGVFDEFRIYESALSEAEILYLSQSAPAVEVPLFAADFNSDGVVNAADLQAWKAGFGAATGASRINGDANGDGAVNGSDFLVWQRQFGSGMTTPTAAAVPEPATGLLALCGLAAAMAGVRSQSRKS